jgi:hypothetical protein
VHSAVMTLPDVAPGAVMHMCSASGLWLTAR